MTNYLIISSLLNFLAASVLAISSILPGRPSGRNVSFGVFSLSVAIWSAAYFLWQISPDRESALMFTRLLMVGASFVPVTLFDFVCRFTGTTRLLVTRLAYSSAIVMVLLIPGPEYIRELKQLPDTGYWPMAGSWFKFFLIYFALFTLESLRRLAILMRDTKGLRARQTRYILIALGIGFVGGATNFPLWYGIPIPPLGNGLVLVYIVMMANALSRTSLSFLNADFLKGLVLVMLAVTMAIFYVMIQSTLYWAAGEPMVAPLMLTSFLRVMIIALCFIWLGPRINNLANRLTSRVADRSGSRISDLTKRIVGIGEERRIFEESVEVIDEVMSPARLALFYRAEFDSAHLLRAQRRWGGTDRLPVRGALADYLRERPGSLVFEELEDLAVSDTPMAVIEACRELQLELVVPLTVDHTVWGILCCGGKGGDGTYSSVDIALLESLCLQIGITVRARQLERRANQADKLISLGTLAAGLAHEMRNPLVSIRTFASLIEEQGGDAEFRREFKSVVQRDVGRITTIIENVSAFAENHTVVLSPVDLGEVLNAVREILQTDLAQAGVKWITQGSVWPRVQGNFSQLQQVFLNLANNACHAMAQRKDGLLTFSYELRPVENGLKMLVVSVTDNGTGIPEELLANIFEPFVTTKATGTDGHRRGLGLGLAIVKRIIEGHHGAIQVTSVLDKGTTFLIHLPCAHDQTS